MDELTFAKRRDRVRDAVIQPLEAMGMRKPRAMTVEDFAAFKDRLAERLAWLSEEWHAPLVEVIRRNAEPSGRKRETPNPPRDIWPSEAAILNWAERLSPMGGGLSRLVGTYMRSRAGREAWERSTFEASRLEVYLVQFGRPPDDGAWLMIRKEAAELADRYHDTAARVRDRRATAVEEERVRRWQRRVEYLGHLINGDLDRCPELAA